MNHSSELENIIQKSIALAEQWQNEANALRSSFDRKIQNQMMDFLKNPTDKVLFTELIDQGFRPKSSWRATDQILYLLKKRGIPHFLSAIEKAMAKAFMVLGKPLSPIAMPFMINKLRSETSHIILQGEEKPLSKHLSKRRAQGIRMNINHLGEAVLGEEEATARLNEYLNTLRNSNVGYVSVKISGIFSQINSIAFDQSVETIVQRLEQMYTAAIENPFIAIDGEKHYKFVNLDMEEYKDLEMTIAAFMKTLDKPEFKNLTAGIVLQAYIPDSFLWQQTLTEWAKKRVQTGGSPIKIRLVKGANLEMESLESSIRLWEMTTYPSKVDVDASFKNMVDFGLQGDNIKAVHLGIASHNIFELAYAYLCAKEAGVLDHIQIEMLEGMADHIRKALFQDTGDVLLYAPVVKKQHFVNAMAYLVRRMDENTAEDNFIRHSFNLEVGSPQWDFLKQQFVQACHRKDKLKHSPNRQQNRLKEDYTTPRGSFHTGKYSSEPDTDWVLPVNRQWAEQIRDKWKKDPGVIPEEIPLVIAGKEVFADRKQKEIIDISQSTKNIIIAKYALGNESDVETACKTAKEDPDGWRNLSYTQRHEILSRVAMELRKARGDLLGVMAANTGKVFMESDIEISEAIDFAEFYPYSIKDFLNLPGIQMKPKGVGLVIPPWNFPTAIPAGGMLAALATGNTVIIKPSSNSVYVAWILCQCFWKAGISKNTLQFLPCPGSSIGSLLTRRPEIDFIILTGGTDTGLQILQDRPDCFLAAETGGKNATIVTAAADRDNAISHIIHSAFSNCGQKCSATSLLILENEIYHDPVFKRQLVDAVMSYPVGSAWDFKNKMGALIHPPKGDLERSLKEIESGEEWVIPPENLDNDPYMWRPSIKWNVREGSYCHMTEFFGPMLSVMRADNLDHAIEITNATGYGLTSGLESLDDREKEKWKNSIKAGNLYINRVTTGAIVLRQPFGGMGKSAIGAGIKVGGPNYVAQFMEFTETGPPSTGDVKQAHPLINAADLWNRHLKEGKYVDLKNDIQRSIQAVHSYLYNYETLFGIEKDYFHLRGEDNIIRYLPIGSIVIRLSPEDTLFECLARIAAAQIAKCKVILSLPSELSTPSSDFLQSKEAVNWLGSAQILTQTDEELIAMIPQIQRIRYASPDRVPRKVYEAAAQTGFYISRNPVLAEGRIELLQYFQEQSISHAYHRYGNLGVRGVKEKA